MAITLQGLKQLGYTPEDFTLQDDTDGNGVYIKSWISSDAQPTVSAIEAAEVEWQTAYDAQDYARSREVEYPTIVDQLDDIYHNGIDAWKATIKVTKDNHIYFLFMKTQPSNSPKHSPATCNLLNLSLFCLKLTKFAILSEPVSL